MKRKWIIISVLILTLNPVSIILLWMAVASYIDRNPINQTHMLSGDWLPREATDVSRFSNYNLYIYDCRIPLEIFRKLSVDKGWHPIPIKEPKEYVPAEFTQKIYSSDYDSLSLEQKESLRQKVFDGYFYEIIENDGGGIRVIYDTRNSRLYFEGRIR